MYFSCRYGRDNLQGKTRIARSRELPASHVRVAREWPATCQGTVLTQYLYRVLYMHG